MDLLEPIQPESRFPSQVSYSKNFDLVWANSVEEAERETLDYAAPNIQRYYWPCSGRVLNAINPRFDLIQERRTQTLPLVLIEKADSSISLSA